jgi:MYXO-CTERM domain-containing protein
MLTVEATGGEGSELPTVIAFSVTFVALLAVGVALHRRRRSG